MNFSTGVEGGIETKNVSQSALLSRESHRENRPTGSSTKISPINPFRTSQEFRLSLPTKKTTEKSNENLFSIEESQKTTMNEAAS
jgi:hypothetical protein